MTDKHADKCVIQSCSLNLFCLFRIWSYCCWLPAQAANKQRVASVSAGCPHSLDNQQGLQISHFCTENSCSRLTKWKTNYMLLKFKTIIYFKKFTLNKHLINTRYHTNTYYTHKAQVGYQLRTTELPLIFGGGGRYFFLPMLDRPIVRMLRNYRKIPETASFKKNKPPWT